MSPARELLDQFSYWWHHGIQREWWDEKALRSEIPGSASEETALAQFVFCKVHESSGRFIHVASGPLGLFALDNRGDVWVLCWSEEELTRPLGWKRYPMKRLGDR